MTYTAKTTFTEEYPTALAVYCSDGRFTDSVEELLHSLGHARLDTLTMPGGPALLEPLTGNFASVESVRTSLSFLVRGHALERVVLLSHQGCGFYRERFRHDAPAVVMERQKRDLHTASAWIKRSHASVTVDRYYARIAQGRVVFERQEG